VRFDDRQLPVRLRCERLCVRYGAVEALSEISTSVEPGERIVACGPAASGKTTWLKCLAGLLRPTSGRVFWDDLDVATLTQDQRRGRQSAFGMVFQSDALFDSKSVLDNVALPLEKRGVAKAEAHVRAREVLDRVGLSAAVTKRPEELSGGMKKRVGVARAIVARPMVLLADDPFAGLDPDSEASIARLLLEVSEGRTLVVAIPDPLPSLPLTRVLRFNRGLLEASS
jgi:phospholipid/cholesterol/gamma-HCH transport system ATP-binding protein